MNIDIAAVFGYLNDFAGAILPLFSLFGIIAGLYLLGTAAKKLMEDSRSGAGDGPNFSAIFVRVLIAGVMLQFSLSVDWTKTGMLSGIGGGARSSMALVVNNTSPTWNGILNASFLWLSVIGVAGMFRGFLKFNKAASGEGQQGGDDFWAGLWHVVGGAILINIGMS